MGIYTTRRFTRRKALQVIQSAIEDPSTSNEQLGDMLDGILRPMMYNAIVVPDYLKDEDCEDIDE